MKRKVVEKINKIDKFLTKANRKARRQVINTTNEGADITIVFMGIKWIIGNSMKIMSIKSTVLLKWTNPLKDANYREEKDIMNSLVCVKKNYICS